MTKTTLWILGIVLAFIVGGTTLGLTKEALGPDDSDKLAASSKASTDGWKAAHVTEVLEDDHDIEVVRVQTDAGTTWVRELQLCEYKSQIGDDAPKAVGSCRTIPTSPSDQLAANNG